MEHPTKEGVESTEVLVENCKKWPQYLAASLATLYAVCVGTVDGWTSPALPYLQEPRVLHHHNSTNTTLYYTITDDEASWIGSLAPLGALLGAIPAGYLANVLGRRLLLLLLVVPLMLGWIIIFVAQDSVPWLYCARFIMGIACGAATVATPLYNEEIAEVRVRGTLGVNMDMMFNVGILYIYVVGALDSYVWLSVSACVVPAIFAVTFFWMPESPVFLLSKGQTEKAEQSLRWLRGIGKTKSPDIERELGQMQKFLNESLSKKTKPVTEKTKCRVFKECFADISMSSPTAKAVRIIFGLMTFQQLTGIDAVIYYTVDIFRDAGSSLSPFVCTVVVGILQLISTYIPSLIVDRAGRRILLILSELGMAVSLLVLSLHFAMQNNRADVSWTGWIPLAAVNMFIVAFSIGFGPLPWLIMAELLSAEAKVWVSSMAVCLNWSLTFAVTKLFPIINRDLGPAMTYGGFCFICILGTAFVILFVPETQGKSREDIQLELIAK
ncbi:facilitated trehalose transporter Tret1-2 homolog [Periplaneta americana]|uniref:facilitated trehalose transporter Tret1-2 homolog n=1 Tax=Periplaneta americana TaxID=6978 RepID=UPI0037E94C18